MVFPLFSGLLPAARAAVAFTAISNMQTKAQRIIIGNTLCMGKLLYGERCLKRNRAMLLAGAWLGMKKEIFLERQNRAGRGAGRVKWRCCREREREREKQELGRNRRCQPLRAGSSCAYPILPSLCCPLSISNIHLTMNFREHYSNLKELQVF